MFDLFRSRDKSVRILLGVILGVVAISMVTYLIPGSGASGFTQDDGLVIAKIGDEKVTTLAAQQAVQNAMQGQRVPASLIGYFAPQAVQQLIDERAMAYEAKRLGIAVSDDDVAATIRQELPPQYFGKDGKINQDALADVLSRQNMTIPQFVDDTRRQLQSQRLRELLDSSIVVTKSEVEQEFKRRNEKVKISYVLVKPAQFDQQVQVTPADVQAYFNSHKRDYQTPEKRSLAIVVLDPAKIQQTLNPTDAELQSTYNSSLDRFRSPERVKVRHILITTSKDMTDAQAQAKAADLLKQLKSGADFSELAKKYSKDPGSAAQGGEVGFMTRGQMVKPFEDAAFSLKPGELSGLVKTTYGYHIVQTEAHEDAHVKPFSEVRETLAAEYRKNKANDSMQKLADRAEADLRKDPAHPEKAAQDVNGDLVRADNVKLADPLPQIGVSQELQTAIGSLKQGGITAPVVVQTNKLAVAEVTSYSAAHPASLDEVRPQVEASVRRQKIDEMVSKRVNDLLAKAKADGNDLAKAAQEVGAEIKDSQDFDRQGAVEGFGSAAALGEAFSAKDGTILGPVSAADGKAVVKVLSHTPANMSGFASQEATLRTELKNKVSRERLPVFADGIRKKLESEHKIRIQQDVLNRFLQSMKGSA